MKIEFYIGTLLYQHDCVVIPGFGGFIANYASAYIHPVQNTFVPPSRQIMFNASLLHNDGLLATHIASEEGISFADALNRIAEEVVAIHAKLNSGNSVIFDGFGSLCTNHENSIVFTPQSTNNYLEDAYGLPTFVSPAIRRNGFQSNQDTKAKGISIHLPVAVRRIAAVALPLIAIGMWSLFNTDRINNFSSSNSSIFPSEILSPFEGASIKKSIPSTVALSDKAAVHKAQLLWGATKETVETFDAGISLSRPAIIDEKSEILTIPATLPEIKIKETGHFFIISGAFKSKENAEKRLGELKTKNFEATLAGQNKKGLYLVSVATCNDEKQATLKMKEILGKGIEAAWILKK